MALLTLSATVRRSSGCNRRCKRWFQTIRGKDKQCHRALKILQELLVCGWTAVFAVGPSMTLPPVVVANSPLWRIWQQPTDSLFSGFTSSARLSKACRRGVVVEAVEEAILAAVVII